MILTNQLQHRMHDPSEHDRVHVHGQECGHRAVPHDHHLDYLHDGHWHAPHDGHCDEHPDLDR
jgi:zinc transport system permease protein